MWPCGLQHYDYTITNVLEAKYEATTNLWRPIDVCRNVGSINVSGCDFNEARNTI